MRNDLNKPITTGLERDNMRSQASYDLQRAQEATVPRVPPRNKRPVRYMPTKNVYPRRFIDAAFPDRKRQPKVNFRQGTEAVSERRT